MNKFDKDYEKRRCPVCGNSILMYFEICECGWQNDPLQFDNPNYKGGANEMSLNEAKRAYKEGKEIY